jgi:hypothetical protein
VAAICRQLTRKNEPRSLTGADRLRGPWEPPSHRNAQEQPYARALFWFSGGTCPMSFMLMREHKMLHCAYQRLLGSPHGCASQPHACTNLLHDALNTSLPAVELSALSQQ